MERVERKKKWLWRAKIALAVYALHYILFGYHFISGRVVDEETGKPIEGAVVLGVWTYQAGIGLTHTVVYKAEDDVTDEKGRFFIWGVWNPLINRWLLPFIDKADLTVYKRGYVAWNNIATWSAGPRKDFAWKNGLVVKMEKWKDEYSFIAHGSFISRHTTPYAIPISEGGDRFFDAINWERAERVKEQSERDRNRALKQQEGGK